MQPGRTSTNDLNEVPLGYDPGGSSASREEPELDMHPDAVYGREYVRQEQARIRRNRQTQVTDRDESHQVAWVEPEPTIIPADILDAIEAQDAALADPPVRSAHAVKRQQRRRKPGRPRREDRDPIDVQIADINDDDLLSDAGVEPFYSTTEAAQFFDRTTQWIYWGLGRAGEDGPKFVYVDGTPIVPDRIGDPVTGRRRFTLPLIKEILLSSYRRGNIEPDELKRILRRIRINELGGEWREREGWRKIKGKWVHPDRCEKVNGRWVKTKEDDE